MNEIESLICKIQKTGDREAADCLVRLYYDEIFRFVRKQTVNADAAFDLTQDIFIGMLRTLAHYDGKKASFRTWLYKIATNKTVDYFRSRAANLVETLPIDEVEPVDETDFTRQIEDADFAGWVCALLAALPGGTQRIFRLHVFGGYTFREIAEGLEMPEGTVKTMYYRLVNILRKEFSDYDGQG
ncbi:MAG: RNA polymerase sigma factor [Christensenellaceae bacterium]|nr:RNA polymerase sigma factor [Christensenellaceae bacterium]